MQIDDRESRQPRRARLDGRQAETRLKEMKMAERCAHASVA
jgi:hypothetical protein